MESGFGDLPPDGIPLVVGAPHDGPCGQSADARQGTMPHGPAGTGAADGFRPRIFPTHVGGRTTMEMIPRRDLVVASLLATAATSLRGQPVEAAGVDASMTQVVQADAIPWKQLYNFPDGTAEQAPMHGIVGEPGQY